MGRRGRRLRAGRRAFRRQLRRRRRRFRGDPGRPPHNRLSPYSNGYAARSSCAARTGGHRRRYVLKIVSMLRLFQAGVIAALMQGVAILLVTLLVFSYAHHRIEHLQVPTDDPTVLSLVPLLATDLSSYGGGSGGDKAPVR